MRPSRFTDAEILGALRQVQAGGSAVQICRGMGISETTFYRWRKQFATGGGTDRREITRLREENDRLKQIVANLLLETLA
jgi:putative transposase